MSRENADNGELTYRKLKIWKSIEKKRIWGGRGGFRKNLFLCIAINMESGFIKRTKKELSKGTYVSTRVIGWSVIWLDQPLAYPLEKQPKCVTDFLT